LRYVIEDSGCAGAAVELAANSHVVSIVDSLGLDVRLLLDSAAAGWLRYEDALAESRADFEPSPLGDDHLAFLPYTSGSTGKPKGVALTHVGQCWWIGCLHKHWPTPAESGALAAVPLYHKNAMAGGSSRC
jgi:long-chain acyl-CoA synthetase